MDILGLILILGTILAATLAFVYLAFQLQKGGGKGKGKGDPFTDLAEKDVEHIFNDEFREELRNRGRLHFEKIIGENSMFLQQDLRLTTSQLNEYMKSEITKKLQEEFAKYEQSITDAKELAIESITKTQEAIEQQRQMMSQQLTQEIAAEKTRLLKRFEDNMADIVNHYVLAAIGNQIDLNDQLEYILSELNENKKEILEDITHGG
ncbi:MAG: hypothetical protein V4702_02150 [Patescibacteria group bacterium]